MAGVPPAARTPARVDPVKARAAFMKHGLDMIQDTDQHAIAFHVRLDIKDRLDKCQSDIMELLACKRQRTFETIGGDGRTLEIEHTGPIKFDEGCRVAFMDLMIQAMGRLETGLAIPHYQEGADDEE